MPAANSYDSPAKPGGNLEDIRSVLTILEPEETPFLTSIAKVSKAKSTFVEVGVDSLDKPRRRGSREGDPAKRTSNKVSERTRFGAYCQRFTREFGVTDVQQIITKRGGNAFTDDEYADSQAKAYREIKRDMEAAFLSNSDHQGGSEEEMLLRGYFAWTGGALPTDGTPGSVPTKFQTPAAMRLTGIATLVETGSNSLNSWMKAARGVYGMAKRYTGLAGLNYIEQIDSFTGVSAASATKKYIIDDFSAKREVDMVVRGFQTSFGTVDFMSSDFAFLDVEGNASTQTTDNIAIYNPELWLVDFLYDLGVDEENEDGGGQDGRLKAICSLLCKNPRGSGFIRN